MTKFKFAVKSLVFFSIVTAPIVTSAEFNVTQPNTNYLDVAEKINVLKIIDEDDIFKSNEYLTKEEFLKVVIKVTGNENIAKETDYINYFNDVQQDRWSSQYITYAANEGIIKGDGNGYFYPEKEISFAEASTIMVNTLKNKEDLYSWPDGYVENARKEGLVDRIRLNYDQRVPKVVIDKMLNKLWIKNIKENDDFNYSAFDLARFSDEIIVLANSKIDDKLRINEILTNKGVFYNRDTNNPVLLGGLYNAVAYENVIPKILGSLNNLEQYRVVYKNGDKLNLIDSQGNEKKSHLNPVINYYYKGKSISFDKAQNIIEYNSTIIFGLDKHGKEYEYALILDPIYTNEVIVNKENILGSRIGKIRFSDGLTIIKDGKLINREDIKLRNVLYFVTDINKNNPYVLVLDTLAEGIITDIQINNVGQRFVQIDGINYMLSEKYDIRKLRSKSNYLTKNNFIQTILDKDGNVIHIYENTLNYAVVINYEINIKSEDNKGVRGTLNKVKLLHPNGEVKWYLTKEDPKFVKNKLVKYSIRDTDIIEMETQNFNLYEDLKINKSEQLLGDYSIDKNVKIYNLIESTFRTDTKVELIDWNDMPSGIIPGNKIYHIGTYSDFNDVNVLVCKDIFDESYKIGYLNNDRIFSYYLGNESYSYLFEVDGKTYDYITMQDDMYKSQAYLLKINDGIVSMVDRELNKIESSQKIQAFDVKRIKLNDKVYRFDKNFVIYVIDKNGKVKKVSEYEIDINQTYEEVSIFTDNRTYNLNKIKLVVVKR